MKKILLVAQNGLNKGGIQTVIMTIVRNLNSLYTFDIIVFTPEKRFYEDEFMRYGGKIFRINHNTSNNKFSKKIDFYIRQLRDRNAIKKIIENNGTYCAIHCNNYLESAIALHVAKEKGIPIRITQAHVICQSSKKWIRRLFDNHYKKRMKQNCTHMIGCSEAACQSMFGASTPYKVISNPYDEVKFDFFRYEELVFKAPVLIQVGNFSELKNQFFSLAVFNEVVKEYPDAHFNYIGFDVDEYKRKLEKAIHECNLNNNVTIYPSDADTPKLLSESCYLMLPSKTEAFGIVLIEAQAMGLTCFASDVVPRLSNAGGCRYLSIKDSPCVWAQAIIDDFKITKGKHTKYDCSRYVSSHIAEQYRKIYNERII